MLQNIAMESEHNIKFFIKTYDEHVEALTILIHAS